MDRFDLTGLAEPRLYRDSSARHHEEINLFAMMSIGLH